MGPYNLHIEYEFVCNKCVVIKELFWYYITIGQPSLPPPPPYQYMHACRYIGYNLGLCRCVNTTLLGFKRLLQKYKSIGLGRCLKESLPNLSPLSLSPLFLPTAISPSLYISHNLPFAFDKTIQWKANYGIWKKPHSPSCPLSAENLRNEEMDFVKQLQYYLIIKIYTNAPIFYTYTHIFGVVDTH